MNTGDLVYIAAPTYTPGEGDAPTGTVGFVRDITGPPWPVEVSIEAAEDGYEVFHEVELAPVKTGLLVRCVASCFRGGLGPQRGDVGVVREINPYSQFIGVSWSRLVSVEDPNDWPMLPNEIEVIA